MKKRGVFVFVVCVGFMASPFAAVRHAKAAASVPATPLVCSGRGAKASYLATARKSPLYGLLKSKLGEPTACVYKEGELLVKFAHGGILTMTSGPDIEYFEEEATFLTSGATVSRDEAVVALKKVANAMDASPPPTIDWTQFAGPIPSGPVQKELVDGDTCNFKVHINMDKGVVVAIGDSMAC